MKKFVIVEIEVDDILETACHEKCLYYNYKEYFCPLFQSHTKDFINFIGRERCTECLTQEVPK